MPIKQAVILVGGKGSRLKPFTNKLPKPLVSVNNRPFCDYLIKSLYDNGINKILFLTGYKHKYFHKRYKSNNNISIVLCDHQARDLLACVDSAAIISNGKVIAQGTPSNLITNIDAKNAYFGESFKIS